MQLELTKSKTSINKLLLRAVEHSRPFIILLMVAVLSLVVWFIYQNVYIPLTRAVELAELKETTAVVRPDTKLFEETLTELNLRTNPATIDVNAIRNPFITPPPPSIDTPETIPIEPIDEIPQNL